jgi:hypothetical protein
MAGTEPRNEGQIEKTSVGEVDVEEVGCETATEATIEGRAEPVSEGARLAPPEEAELDEMLRDAKATGAAKAVPPGLGRRGGGLAGSEKPIERAMAIGTRNGLTITSAKRSSGAATSDHHVSQKRSSAADMSNGSNPTPQMDKTCREIATLLGHPEFRAGNLRVTLHGYRVQLLYRTNIGGNHFNHVHVGVRVP